MTPTLLLAIAVGSAAPVDHPRTYLASIAGIKFGPGESIDKFEIETWGVEFKAVCNIPNDWEVTAGSFGPGGRLVGVAGHGASQLRAADFKKLRALVLIRLSGPVQKHDIRDATGVIPATFNGFADVQSGWDDRSRKARLTFENFRLTQANACPSRR